MDSESDKLQYHLKKAQIPASHFKTILISDIDRCQSCFQIQKSIVRELKQNYPDCLLIVMASTEKKGYLLTDGDRENAFYDKDRIFKKFVNGSHSIWLYSKDNLGDFSGVGVY